MVAVEVLSMFEIRETILFAHGWEDRIQGPICLLSFLVRQGGKESVSNARGAFADD